MRRLGLALAALLVLVFPAAAKLTVLAEPPEWRLLDGYQNTVTAAEFAARLPLFSPNAAIREYLDLDDRRVVVFADKEKQRRLWELTFAEAEGSAHHNLQAHTSESIKPQSLVNCDGLTPSLPRPLRGRKICLDPGHIGGEWANTEERHFRARGGPWIDEAELNFITCRLIEEGLRAAGATVVWTREELGVPATSRRPPDFVPEAIAMLWRLEPKARRGDAQLLKRVQWYAELIFYRVAEIRARARVVEKRRPDLTLCVHYNALGGQTRYGPKLYKNINRIVLFTHGNYSATELEFDDMKFGLFRKLLENSAGTEVAVADAIARRMALAWHYPPEHYDAAIPAGRTPYVQARNLLANRLFHGPTVFVEGPFMDDALSYKRLAAGDYDDERVIEGKSYRSIYREYADTVIQGVIDAIRAGALSKN